MAHLYQSLIGPVSPMLVLGSVKKLGEYLQLLPNQPQGESLNTDVYIFSQSFHSADLGTTWASIRGLNLKIEVASMCFSK